MKGKPYQEHVEFRTTLGVESFRLDANPSVADLVELALQAENELPVIVSATVTLLSHNDGIDGLNYGPAIDDIDISLVNGVREGKRGKRIRMGELTWKDQEWLELECYRELERQGHVFEDIPQ